MSETLCASLLAKVDEQIERTTHLIELLPAHRGDAALLLGHLLECMAGFCAVLVAALPERLAHFAALRELPVNHACAATEAVRRIATYRERIAEGFAVLRDHDLSRLLPTVFVPRGETVLTLLLGNLEHLINHKHQLFVVLRTLGCQVGTADLYRLRG